MLLSVFLTQIINLIRDFKVKKYEINERFFYEMYPKRMKVYDETMNILTEMSRKTPEIISMTLIEINRQLYGYFRQLFYLCNKLCIYGSRNSHVIIFELFNETKVIFGIADFLSERPQVKVFQLNASLPKLENLLSDFAICVDRHHTAFTESIKRETGGNFIDKKINEFLKNTVAG